MENNKRVNEANKFLKFIKGNAHVELSVGNIQNKQYDLEITENMLNDNLWCGVTERISVPETAHTGSKKHECGIVKWLWIDFDGKSLTEAERTDLKAVLARIKAILEPSLAIASGHGIHGYFLLDKPSTDIDRLENLMARMIPRFGADAARKNINSMMRVPGSMNLKDESKPVEVRILESKLIRYSLEELEAKFPAIQREQKKAEFFKQIESPYNGTVNNSLYRETLMLLEKGWSIDTVYDQMESKYKSLGEEHSRFENTFNSALKKFDISNIKNPNFVRANQVKSEIMQSLNSGNIEVAISKLERLQEKPSEVIFDTYKEGDKLEFKNLKTFNIGNTLFDSFSPFESESVCLIAGLTGQGKTTIALNLVKAFSDSNSTCDILFLESESETKPYDIKRFASKIGIKNLFMATFPRFEDMKKGFMGILDKHKEVKGKYPEIVFIDTFEKMNKSSENFALKLNTEALSYMCQQTKCLFISLSQFSSTVFKASKKDSRYYPMSIQQGGMDVINNVNTWISLKRRMIIDTTGNQYFNDFYFGKVRSMNASTNLFDKIVEVPYRNEDMNLIFKNLEIKEDTI